MNADATERRYELDWLRVWAILVVFVYHSSRFFNLGDWHVKNAVTYTWVEMWNHFAVIWMMPLFFFISGASLFYATGKPGGWRAFYTDKFQRLMVPVLIGTITHGVLQVYFERYTHGQFSGSLFSFIPEYFRGLYWGIDTPGNFAFHGMHLWYLLFLFLYGSACYHLFSWLRRRRPQIPDWAARILTAPGLIYVWFSVPLLMMDLLIPAAVLDVGSGGWGFLFYLWFLIAGFLTMSSERVRQSIEKQRWLSLWLGVALSVASLWFTFGPPSATPTGATGQWARDLSFGFGCWCWLFAILGFGMRLLAFDRPWLRHANEGVLPFFILHQPVLLIVGYFVVAWGIHDALKWAIIFVSSFVIIVALYAFVVWRFQLLRFLFGMKSTHLLSHTLTKTGPLVVVHVLFVGTIVFAAAYPTIQARRDHSQTQVMFDPATDVVLDSRSITDSSPTGVQVVEDIEASFGKAIAFSSGGKEWANAHPEAYVDMRFAAAAGRYTVWLRGRSDLDNDQTDSIWLQLDDQIGKPRMGVRLGNWLEIHPAGAYAWASDNDDPIYIELKHTGDHIIRLQPRQTPHRIDQIWLSRHQHRVPATSAALVSTPEDTLLQR